MSDFEKVYKITFNTTQSQRKVKALQVSLNNVRRASVRAGNEFRTHIDRKGTRAFKNVQRASAKAEKGIKRISRASAVAGNRLKAFSQKWNRYVTLPIALAGVASLKFARDFNKGLAKVATLIPGNTKRVEELRGEIMQLSKDSGASLGDLTEGVYTAISAWGDGADTIEKMRVATMASQAGYATTEESLGLLTKITEIYGDNTVKATEHVADMAFVANKLAIKAPFAEMAASMGKAAPIAKTLGISQEELFATMTAGAGVTGNVAEVATQMRSLYVAITKETPRMTKVVKDYNREMGTQYKTAGEMLGSLGTIQFLQRMKKASSSTKDFQKILGGRVEGLNLALALTGSRAEKYNEALEEMTQRSGQLKEAHKEVTDGVDKSGFTWDKMLARLKILSVRIGQALIPVIEKFMNKIEPLIKYLENMDEEALDFYLTLGKWAIIIGVGSKLMTGLGSLGSLITGAGGAAAGAAPKIMSLAGAYGVLSAAIGGVTAGLMIHDLLIEPAAKKDYEAKQKAKDADLYADRLIKTAQTPEELEAGLRQIEKMEEDVGGLTGGVAPTALYKATGYKTERYQGLEATGKAKAMIKKELRAREHVEAGMAALTGARGTQGASGMYEGKHVDNSVNITLQAEGVVDPAGVKKAMGDAARQIKQTTQGLAPAEQ